MKICKIDGCEVKMYGKGYCLKHYTQIKRHGHILCRTKYDPNEFIVNGDIVTIILYDQYGVETARAIVDKDDIEVVKRHKWCANKFGSVSYCATRIGAEILYIHHLLVGKKKIDHRNRNGLDNRRSNLRECTHQQNLFNVGLRKDNISGSKGVSKSGNKWSAEISKSGNKLRLGYFDTPQMAAVAYNEAAKKLFGEFAYLNQVQP